MSLFDIFKKKGQKDLNSLRGLPSPPMNRVSVWSPVTLSSFAQAGERDYHKLARDAYLRNPFIFTCVDMIASACSNLKYDLYDGDNIITQHPVLDLMSNVAYGNRKLSRTEFIYDLVTFLMLSGNAFVWMDMTTSPPRQLMLLNPLEVRIQMVDGRVTYYIHNKEVDNQREALIHFKLFHPLQKIQGISPITSASLSVDLNNAARVWNASLLEKSTKIDGFIEVEHGTMTDQQRETLKREFDSRFGGANRSGSTMVMPGGMKFTPQIMSVTDMDWENVMKLSGREIAMALKIPGELLGYENRTYSNVKEAKAGLYSENILPLFNKILDFFKSDLLSLFSNSLRFEVDMDSIDVLKRDRNLVTKQTVALFDSGIITKNEARKLLGYDEVPEGDDFKSDSNEDLTNDTE